MDEKLEIGDLIARVGGIVLRARLASALYFAAVVASGTVLDFNWSESSVYLILSSIVTLVAGYLLTKALMRSEGLAGGVAGFDAYFGLSIIVGLGTVVGLLVLIIPGNILAVRWLPAYAVLLAGDASASDVPGASWDMTRGHFWPLLAALLVGVVPLFAIVIALGASEAYAEAAFFDSLWYIASLALTNAMIAAFGVFVSSLGIAVYATLRGERGEVAEVFA